MEALDKILSSPAAPARGRHAYGELGALLQKELPYRWAGKLEQWSRDRDKRWGSGGRRFALWDDAIRA